MDEDYSNHKLSATIAFALGWPANLLLIWLIFKRTTESLRIWSRVLLQSAIIDFILLAVAFIVQPVIISDDKNIFYFSNGLFAEFFAKYLRQFAYYIFVFCLEFAKHAVAVQCFFRWLLICRERELSNIHYAQLLCIPAIITSSQVGIIFWECLATYWQSKQKNGKELFFIMHEENQYSRIVDAFWLACNLVTFSVILVTNLLIWIKTRRTLVPESPHRQEINRQVGLVLLIQAILPLALSMFPTLIIATYNAIGLQIPGWLSILFTQAWTSFAYPILAILLIGQYRRALGNLICRKKKQTSTNQQQQISQMQIQPRNLTINFVLMSDLRRNDTYLPV